MINLLVVDSSSESRKRIIDEINECFLIEPSHLHFLPKLSLKPIPPEELSFAKVPDICIVGPQILRKNVNELARIRRTLPNSAVLVRTDGHLENISAVENLARLGADDILPEDIPGLDLLKKLILHARNRGRCRSGTLVTVDSSKGGLGVTTLVAALGDLGAELGKRTAVIDFDLETQDLSRFLQVRPFVNETLSGILEQQKPLVQELVEECAIQVWGEEDRLFAVPPPAGLEHMHDPASPACRILVSFFEILDSLFDVVLIDRGSVGGLLRKTLHRISDHIIYVSSNDPASLYASVEGIKDAYASMSPGGKIWVVRGFPGTSPLPGSLVTEEIVRAARLSREVVLDMEIPRSRPGGAWPGSGGTYYSRAESRGRKALRRIATTTGIFGTHGRATEGIATGGFIRKFFAAAREAITPSALTPSFITRAAPTHVQPSADGEDTRKEERHSLVLLPPIAPPKEDKLDSSVFELPEVVVAADGHLASGSRSPRDFLSKANLVQ